ncbi:RnfABCDGE type electron transport complex subunit D [Candidatus Gottesmanbacteria bacterium]|nr:RnfABCDGE type electron transport complex subunit D [Candidatus Gottesmanbacteria bacterium]
MFKELLNFKNSKNQIIALLIALLLISAPRLEFIVLFRLFVLCLGFTILFDLVLTYIKTRKFFFPHSAIITGLILTLIVDWGASWYQMVVICLIAISSKVFIKPEGRHIFNPTAFGLLGGWLVFGLYPSWWAPSLYQPGSITIPNILVYIPVVLIFYVSSFRGRRLPTVGTFLFTYVAISTLSGQSASLVSAVSTVFSVGSLFYLFLMVVEPKTSPIFVRKQILYGAFIAAATVIIILILQTLKLSFFDSSLTALLLGNLVFRFWR